MTHNVGTNVRLCKNNTRGSRRTFVENITHRGSENLLRGLVAINDALLPRNGAV